MKPIIEVKGLSKKYRLGEIQPYYTLRDSLAGLFSNPLAAVKGDLNKGEFWALKDINFEVQQGEVVGIIGRNGAGKSTLLKILSQITPPTEGEVILRGRVGSLLEVGTGFSPELTGRENIYLNGAIMGMKRSEVKKRFDEIVDFSEVEKFLDTPLKRYSSGMYMRLAFAVAAHLDPEILIVDEVLAVGDAEFQKKCLGKMGDVASQGRTVLFVSHNMGAVERLCSRAAFFEEGKLDLDVNKTSDAISRYLNNSKDSKVNLAWSSSSSQLQNEFFSPTKMYITNSSGEPVSSSELNGDKDYYLNIEGDVQKINSLLTIGYAIYTSDGSTLYWSYFSDAEASRRVAIKIGKNRIRSKLPTNLLNIDNYRIDLIGGVHFQKWLFEPGSRVPSLNFEIVKHTSKSELWQQKRPGLLAPVLEWKTYV
jgi:lipopolysaccharide transport system ATP-binding protein